MALQKSTATETIVSNAAIRVHCGTDEELRIRGLQNIVLPIGYTTETVTAKEMGRRIDPVIPTGGSFEQVDINYNFLEGDESMRYMQSASINNVQIRDMRFYIEDKPLTGSFCALDLISDPSGCYRVGGIGSPTGNKGELLTGTLQIMPAGTSTIYSSHASGTDLEFTVAVEGSTVASTTQDFVDLGFKVGMTVIADKVDDLDPLYLKIKSVSANLITFEPDVGDEDKITTVTGTANTAIHAGSPMVVIEEV